MTDDNPVSDNPLVDPYAKTRWQDYALLKRDEHGNIVVNGSPGLMAGPGADGKNDHKLSGVPVAGSVENLYFSLRNGDYFSATFDGLAAILEGVSVGINAASAFTSAGGAVGFLAEPIIAWILDHVQPLRLILDELVGNPGTVSGVARTWTNMGNELGTVASQYHQAVQGTQQYWTGDAGAAYRDNHAKQLTEGLNSIGMLCHCWSALVQFMSAIVATAHDLVRDLIAALVAVLIEIGVDAMFYPPPANIGLMTKDGVVEVARFSTLIAKALTLVAEGMAKGLAVATRVLGEVKRLADAIKALVDLVNRGGDAAPAPA